MSDESRNSVVQLISDSVRGIDSSRQLALGIALGFVIGFLPKDNLLFAGMVVVLVLSGANLVTGFLSAVAASLLSIPMQELFHFCGEKILGIDFVSANLVKVIDLPLLAWTDIHHTVVLGGFCVGMAFFIPVYFISLELLNYFRSKLKKLVEVTTLARVDGYSTE